VDVDVPDHPDAVVVHLPRDDEGAARLAPGRQVHLRARHPRRFAAEAAGART
jgi:hypothetical protein